MDERSLLTLLQKRPNEGMKELMRYLVHAGGEMFRGLF